MDWPADKDWDLPRLLAAARGDEPADLVLKGGRVVDVLSHRIIEADVALAGAWIVGLGEYQGRESLDVSGGYVAPSFIDGHIHLESSLLTPAAFARAVVPRGSGAVVADPHEIANVLGLAGVEWLIRASSDLPLDFFFTASSCVPASRLGTSGASLGARDLAKLNRHPVVKALGEVMNFPGLVAGDKGLLAKLKAFRGWPIDGHAPLLTGQALNAYALAGPSSDHECIRLEEAEEKLSRGLAIMIRQGSTARNLADLLPLVNSANSRRFMLVSDDRHADDLLQAGHLNAILAEAVGLGLDPITAVQMASLNPAEHFGLEDKGAAAPGRLADLVVLADLESFEARLVLHRGRVAARDGQALWKEAPSAERPPRAMKIKPFSASDLGIPHRGARVRVIGLVPGQIYTRKLILKPRVVDGLVEADPERDLAKLAVVEWHRATGNIGLGLVQGFGLKTGALASSVAHDCHNLIGAGMSDRDLYAALKRVKDMGGGLCAVREGQVLAELALPFGGLISPLPAAEVAGRLEELRRAGGELGCPFDPFMALSFLALEVIPELKLTDLGLVDVDRFEVVSLFED